MDTKTLYDLLIEAGIDPKHDDAEYDCVEVWRRHLLTDKEAFKEHVVDLLITALEDEETLEKISRNATDAYKDVKRLQDASEKTGTSYFLTIPRCLTAELSNMSGELLVGIHKAATAYIEHHKVDWLSDINAYVFDMEEGMREDREYELAKEQRL